MASKKIYCLRLDDAVSTEDFVRLHHIILCLILLLCSRKGKCEVDDFMKTFSKYLEYSEY